MAISRPYIGITPPFYGTLVETQDDLNAWCERVHRANIRITTHANGDVAIDRTLNACERMLKLYPRADARPKINHCSYLNPGLIRRIKAIGATPSEFSTYAYYNSDKFVFYGEEMMKNMMPYRDLLDAGIKPSTGSDFQPGPFAPLMAIQGMVTRTGWNGQTWGANQRITVDEAILCSTLHGVYSACEEKDKGSITPGKLADYVVMAEDLRVIDPGKIKDVKIVQTVVDGIVRHQA
jgi:predicted amidohydrolase YtcJ